MRRTWLALALMGLLVGGRAQPPAPSVTFLNPSDGALVHERVLLQVKGEGFQDLKTFGFVDFLYAPPEGDFRLIGTDRNTFDGLSLLWDTTALADGAYRLRAEVTDLFNLKGEATVAVFVNNRGNQSFTRRALEALAPAFEALAVALDFPTDLSLSRTVEIIRGNLESAALTFEVTLEDLERLSASAPEVVAQADPFLVQAPLYAQVAGAVRAARERFAALDLEGTRAALETLSAAVRTLSQTRPNGVDFSPLAEVASAIDQATAQLEAFFAASQGESSGSIETAFETFAALAAEAAEDVLAVASSLRAAEASCPLRFLDEAGRPAVQAVPGLPLVLEVAPAERGELALYDAAGNLVDEGAFVDGRFVWTPPAGAGTTFFALRLACEGQEQVKTGRIVPAP